MTTTDETTSRSGLRRNDILAKAAELFAAKGVGATTVREIGNAAGLLSGSLYYHFDSKEAIVKEIVGRFLHGLIDRHEQVVAAGLSPRERLEGLIVASYETIAADHNAARVYQNDFAALRSLDDFPEFAELTERFQKMWMDTIADGVASGELRDDIDPRFFYRLTRDAIWFSARWHRPHAGDLSAHDMATAATAVLLHGFAERPA